MRRERREVGCRSGGGPAISSCGLLTVLAASIAAAALTALNFAPPAHAAALRAATPQLYFGLEYLGEPDITTAKAYETQIGKGMSLLLFYQNWEMNGQLQPFPTDQVTAIRQHGSIPVISWEPWPWTGPATSYSLAAATNPDYSLAAIAGGKWDTFLRQYATAAKAWGHPFFLLFAGEMNGNWEPWAETSNGNSAGQFVQMWRHVHDIFTSVGATNVTWVWCPNTQDGSPIPLAEIYPGDAYVDWAGMDGYNFSIVLYPDRPWRSFSQVFSATYAELVHNIAPTKPIMIGEMASVEEGGSKPDWIRDALTVQLPAHFPRIKALVWFDMSAGAYHLSINTSPESLAAFRSAIASNVYQPNVYAQLDQTPIPPPEEVVPPQAVPGATAVPTYQSMLGGPLPGSIQLVDAAKGAPLADADLTFASGATERTDATGTTHLPPHVLATTLLTITIGSVVITTGLELDAQHGYQLQIDPASGRISRVMVNVVALVVPSALQGSLLAILGLYVSLRVRRRRRRRVGMVAPRPAYRPARSLPRPVAARRRVS